jgi:hypothetical protein
MIGAPVCAAPAEEVDEAAEALALDAALLAELARDDADDPAAKAADSAPLVIVLTKLPAEFVATV